MELLHYIKIIQRRKWILIITTLTTVVVVGLASFMMTPIYSASALVRIAQIQDSNISNTNLNYTERLMNTYTYLLTSGPFLETVIQQLDLDMTSKALAESITIEVLPNTELIEITAESSNPSDAMQIANTISTLLVEQREDLYSGPGRSAREILEDQLVIVQENLASNRETLQKYLLQGANLDQEGEIQDISIKIQAQEQTYAILLQEYDNALITEEAYANSISVAQPATIPDSPTKPSKFMNIAMAAVVGLLGGLGLAFLFENLDFTIHSADELEASAELPMLGAVPMFSQQLRSNRRASLITANGESNEREAFRILRTNIQSQLSNNTPKILMVTGAKQRTGKSTILVNLAVAMAQTGQKVVIIDSNLRTPCLHETFDLTNDLGLSTIVSDPEALSPNSWLEQTKIPRISLLSSGPLPPNPAERLGSDHMQTILSGLLKLADLILLDSPAVLNNSDAATLAPMVDGVVIVATRGTTTAGDLQKALQQMDKVKGKILGVVFNKAII